jgi:hypothetical protein
MRRMSATLVGVLELRKYFFFSVADPVLAGDGAPQIHARPEDVARRTRCGRPGSGWKTDRWTLPSPTCPHPVTSEPVTVATSRPPTR